MLRVVIISHKGRNTPTKSFLQVTIEYGALWCYIDRDKIDWPPIYVQLIRSGFQLLSARDRNSMMINVPSNKYRRIAISSWPIVSMANIVRHAKRIAVRQVGLLEEKMCICLARKETGPVPPPYRGRHWFSVDQKQSFASVSLLRP